MGGFSFQGKVYLATRDESGRPGALTWVGNASGFNLTPSSDVSTQNDSYSGQRLPIGRLAKAVSADLTLTLTEFSAANLAIGLYGSAAPVAGGQASAEAFPPGLVDGDTVLLDHIDASALTLKDSATPSAATVDPGDFALIDPKGGLVQIKSIGSYVQPFVASYTFGDAVNVAMFTQQAPERYLVYSATNTVQGDGTPSRVEVYKCTFDPMSALDLINDDFGSIELKGSALFDPLAAPDPDLGGFGRVIRAGA